MKTNAYAFIIALLCLFIAGNANAITGTCGMVINNPGEYILENDITRCSGGGGYGVKYAIKIQADNVRLDLNGHTISGTGSAYGIYVAGSSFVTIAGPGRIENFNTGISIECRYDSGTGTSYSSNHNTIENLTISGNTFGISFDWAHSGLTYTGNSIDNNTILSNSQIGIYLSDSVDSTISNNIVSGGYYGIVLTNSSGNTIKLNRVTENTYGILLIVASSNNEIYENAICSNREYGLDLACDAHNNHIYHNNFIDNVKHAADFDYDHKSNRWEYNYFSGHDCGQCIFSSYCSNPFTIPCRAQSKDNTPLCEPWPDAPSCGMEERKGSICGFKFHDVNGDGEWTISSEPGISGWEIRLEGPDGMSAMAVTGPDGSYCFTDLPSGIYTVRETLKEEWVQTHPAIPGSHVINLEEGESVCGVNFGNSLTQLTGKIIIQKMTLPPDDQTSFNFIGNGLTPESFSLKDGESKVFDNVQAGSGYSVSETVPEGWSLFSAVCDNGSPVNNISVSSGETVTCTFANTKVIQPGEFCTYTQGGWGSRPSGNNPGSILAKNFSNIYSKGVEVGIPGISGYSMKFTSARHIELYLPAGRIPNRLNRDYINPLSTTSGVFGGQVLALQLNVDFSAAGITQGSGGPVGDLRLCNFGTSLEGKTVSEILRIANTALGGGALPSGFTYSTLNNLVDNLNMAFDNCKPSAWARKHMCR